MKTLNKKVISSLVAIAATGCSAIAFADGLTDAITSGKAYGDFNLRYEGVDQDNALKDAAGLTLRSRLGYTSGIYKGLSATFEVEDSRVMGGIEDFNAAGQNDNPEYSVIADPETTEVDQAFIQYKTEKFLAKAGRQVYTLDGHRFVGHVGWRQDRQTFDAVTFDYMPVKGLSMKYAYLSERNRIFADEQDIDSSDHLVNLSYTTTVGTLVGYSYLLDDEDSDTQLDTYGVSFTGAAAISEGTKFLYTLEYATQETDGGAADFDADYLFVEGGLAISGITAKLGYEVLGSDDGKYGFSTPLATLHKFNGWADQFLGTPTIGLVDTYVSLGGSIFGGGWAIVYHDYEADDGTSVVDDLGDEINVSYTRNFGKNYTAGIKYASYDAGDSAGGKIDTDKLWVWMGVSF